MLGYIVVKGNQSRAFLKKADQLELVLREHGEDVLQKGLPFVQAIRAFSEVVGSCFGGSLTDDYQDKIKEFRGVYMNLGISVTPKVYSFNYCLSGDNYVTAFYGRVFT